MTPALQVLPLPGMTPRLAEHLTEGLDRVERLLQATVDDEDAFVAAASGHLLDAGGKRLRPLLTLLCAQLCDGINDDVVRAAASVELTHLASLYHDDVMDEALVRRDVPSVNAAYDNTTAILVGDLLFGKASQIVAQLGATAVTILADTFVRLCSGQIRDARPRPADADPVAYYLDVLADKTGALIATAAHFGVLFAGGSQQTADVVRQYGERLGVAFQLADDIIDIASDRAESGKVPGTDLREGVDTLAVLFAKASTDPADARLRQLLGADLRDEARHAEALRLLRAHPALEQAREATRSVGAQARSALGSLPDTEAKVALLALVDSATERAR